MGYINGKEILPTDLIEQIQKYVEGQLIYIPCRAKKQRRWGENTTTRQVLAIRNKEIVSKYNMGHRVIELSAEYHLSTQAIYKILSRQKDR